MPIQGEKIYLRAMELSDMDVYQEMLNDESISQNVGGWSFPVSKFEQEHWFQKSVLDPRNKRFSIVLKEADEVVGMVTLTDIDWQNRSAFHGIKLRSSCPKRQGIATDAVMTLMRYAFEEVNLNRLDGAWLAYNKASENLYLKCGWSVEGTKKDAVFRNGKYHDLNITGITKARYLEIKERISTPPRKSQIIVQSLFTSELYCFSFLRQAFWTYFASQLFHMRILSLREVDCV